MQVCFLDCGDDHGVPRVGCECMDIMTASELVRTGSPSQTILTHLSHTIDHKEISAKVSTLAPNISLAHDGLIVEVQE